MSIKRGGKEVFEAFHFGTVGLSDSELEDLRASLLEKERLEEERYQAGLQRARDVNDGKIPFEEQFSLEKDTPKHR